MFYIIKGVIKVEEPYCTDGYDTLDDLDADEGVGKDDVIVQVHLDGTITVGTIEDVFEGELERS